MREVKGATFVRLFQLLVKSVLMYGAEVWGCGAYSFGLCRMRRCRQLEPFWKWRGFEGAIERRGMWKQDQIGERKQGGS